MEDMLIKIFDNIVCKGPEYTERGKRYDEEVERILAPLYESMSRKEVELIRGMVYEATYYAQRDGFLMGARTMELIIKESADKSRRLID